MLLHLVPWFATALLSDGRGLGTELFGLMLFFFEKVATHPQGIFFYRGKMSYYRVFLSAYGRERRSGIVALIEVI